MSKTEGRDLPRLRNAPPTGESLARLRTLYDGEVSRADSQFGALLEAIDSRCDPRETIVILLSDHGEAFGEHGRLLHGNNAHREEVAVPMIWRWPGKLAPGRRVTQPVSTADVAATLAEIVAPRRTSDFIAGGAAGQSLWAGLCGGEFPADRAVLSECSLWGPAQRRATRHEMALTVGTHRLHAHFQRAPSEAAAVFRLYNLSRDPDEQTDLAATAPIPPELLRKLNSVWDDCDRLRAASPETSGDRTLKLTEQEKRRLHGLGYVN